MVILSYEFALAFCLFFCIYWAFYRSIAIQNALLLVAGLLFLITWQFNFLLSLIFVWAVSQGAAIFINNAKNRTKKKLWLWSGLGLLIAHLCFFKYTNFVIHELNDSLLANNNASPLDIVMPIGISFYTFQAISYLVDVYQGKIKPMPPAIFLGFLSFFPTITSGPIFRASAASNQWQGIIDDSQNIRQKAQVARHSNPHQKIDLDERFVAVADLSNLKNKPTRRFILLPYLALALIVFALFKKIVLAGWLESLWVSPVFGNPTQFHGLEVLTAIYAYSLQLFFDFSGYTDLAIALGLLLGFRLPENFNQPYLAKDIQEFWARWHMTLSSWIKDYLYIPLGGNRASFARVQFNIMASFVLSGFWHGAGWNFIIWGAIHGIALVWLNSMKQIGLRHALSQKFPILAVILTFHYVGFGWIFFHSTSLDQAFEMLKALTNFNVLFSLPIVPTLLLMAMAWAIYPKLKNSRELVANAFAKLPWYCLPIVIAIYVVMVFSLAPDGLPNFIYANF